MNLGARRSSLVVAAHPDDEVLGCGGTIPLLGRQGSVRIAILGEGISARHPRRENSRARDIQMLRKEAKLVSRLLGAASIEFEGLPDNRFDTLPLLEIVKRVERWVDKFEPEAVFTHHPGDLNIDHQLTFRAVLTATRPTARCPVKEIYSFEVPSSTEWAFQKLERPFQPNVFVDISETMARKIEGMRRYTSESKPFPHPRSPEALRAIGRRWGSVVGADYAEAFELIRSVR